ncbi:hypothetical protein, partial [Mycobacterium ulcerans]
RSLPDHRFDRQPPPRPPQSTIPQLTSLLINNAGALTVRPWDPKQKRQPGILVRIGRNQQIRHTPSLPVRT